jgi:hypothetical protein
MVLRVCRRELRDPHDAEDAFQATFLILVKRAGGFDGATLRRAFLAVTDQDLRRVVAEIFAPARHTGAFIAISR